MSNNKIKTIAIIDSGIGGLSVLKKIISNNQVGNYIYFADNLYMPYGNKSEKFLKSRMQTLISLLKDKYKADLIIIACNTASCIVNELHLDNVVTMKFNKDYTYLATPLTKKKLQFNNIIKDSSLASIIEHNIQDAKKLNINVKKHVHKYKLQSYKEFVLGCTHYELVEDIFKKHCPNTTVLSNSDFITNEIKVEHNELNVIFLQSKQNYSYEQKMKKILGV